MNEELSKKILIIVVIVIVVLIVLFLLVCVCKPPQVNPSKKHERREVFAKGPLTKNDRFQVQHRNDDSCGCTKPCDCKKKKKDYGGYCPECPDCPGCPSCPSICPPDCPECPRCGVGIGGNCQVNGHCASGLKCDQGECVCPTPNPPSNLTTALVFDQSGPGFRLQITWTAVTGVDFYNIFVSGPSLHTYLDYGTTSVTTPILLPGVYSVKVFAGTDKCGTSEAFSSANEIVIDPVPGGICTRNDQCPSNQFCFQGNCEFLV